MRYWIPKLQLGVLAQPQKRSADKLGGLPWGFPQEQWPLCANCGGAQSFLAQFAHDAERIDLGRPGRTLYLFQCNHQPGECETWSAESGANAGIVLEPEQTLASIASAPVDQLVETEVRVAEWVESEDGIPADQQASFFDDAKIRMIPTEALALVYHGTKLGSVPRWVQSASEGPPVPWRFVGQLGARHRFEGVVPSADEVGCAVVRRVDGANVRETPVHRRNGAPADIRVDDVERYSCAASNFGDSGVAYIFVRADHERVEAKLLWQSA